MSTVQPAISDTDLPDFSEGNLGSIVQCSPPALVISRVELRQGHVIENDGLGPIVAPQWNELGPISLPVCYTRQTKIQLAAAFRVVTAASHDVDIDVRAVSTFGTVTHTWSATAHLTGGSTGDVQVDLGDSDHDLPNAVGCFDAQIFDWSWKTSAGSWISAGISTNTVYVVLGNPAGPKLYLTALDIACRQAAGQSTEAAIVAAVFTPFAARNLRRVGDGSQLSYWLGGQQRDELEAVLKLPAPNGTCQAFAQLLGAVYAAHGIGGQIVRVESDWAFLKGDCEAEIFINTALPAHANQNPPPYFRNHFIVRAPDGQYYDPSYGLGPYQDEAAWKVAQYLQTRIRGGNTFLSPNAITVTGPEVVAFPQATANVNLPQGSAIQVNQFSMSFSSSYSFFLPAGATINGTAVPASGVHQSPANSTIAIPGPSAGTYPFAGACDLFPRSSVHLPHGAALTIPQNRKFRLTADYDPGSVLVFSDGHSRQQIASV
jgi:hypothetical protein